MTRPVVYKFFPNRHELIKAVLEDFREAFAARTPNILENRRRRATSSRSRRRSSTRHATRSRRSGSGGWQLLRSAGHDPEISTISRDFRGHLVKPWLTPLRELTGVDDAEALALSDMFLSGAGEILQRWIEGEFSREQVATLLGRIILAVLSEFTE